jgi:hypothetical protein
MQSPALLTPPHPSQTPPACSSRSTTPAPPSRAAPSCRAASSQLPPSTTECRTSTLARWVGPPCGAFFVAGGGLLVCMACGPTVLFAMARNASLSFTPPPSQHLPPPHLLPLRPHSNTNTNSHRRGRAATALDRRAVRNLPPADESRLVSVSFRQLLPAAPRPLPEAQGPRIQLPVSCIYIYILCVCVCACSNVTVDWL